MGLGDRLCLAFMNTAVTRGRGEMIVTTTGMDTQIGHIADLLNETTEEKTPLQKRLDSLTLVFAGLAGGAFILMLLLGLQRGDPFDELFVAGVALAISAIPTGMPVVITTLYSMGTRTLAEHHAIVKRLPSVETLGSVSAICSDKTGTLTLNKMTAREVAIPGQNATGSLARGTTPRDSCCTPAEPRSISMRPCCRWRCAPTPGSRMTPRQAGVSSATRPKAR